MHDDVVRIDCTAVMTMAAVMSTTAVMTMMIATRQSLHWPCSYRSIVDSFSSPRRFVASFDLSPPEVHSVKIK